MNEILLSLKSSLMDILSYIPDILQVLVVLIIGWLIAKAVKNLIKKLLVKSKWDEKFLSGTIGSDTNNFISKLVYYLLMIIVLMIALEMLGVSQVLNPLRDMIGEFFTFIPNLIAAGILVFIGYMIATFVSSLVNMGGKVLDNIVEKTGFKSTDQVVGILRQVVFVIILIPFVIFALDALQLEAISGPANEILSDIMNIIPSLLAAGVIIALFIFGGRFLKQLLENLLQSMQVDSMAEKIGLGNTLNKQNTNLSSVISNVVYFFIVFFGIISGVDLLGLEQLSEVLDEVLHITGNILFGVVILIIGNYISKLITSMLSDGQNKFLSTIVRVATMVLFLAMALRAMNIAPDIVNLAFGLTLGAVAVVIALSYGLGGREAAGEHFKEIIQKFKKD